MTLHILHILSDGPTKLSDQMIGEQSREHEVDVVELKDLDTSYEDLIDKIFSSDRVISW